MKQRLRKCTGCQEMKDKKDLVRVVRLAGSAGVHRTPAGAAGRSGAAEKPDAGAFSLDTTGKMPGRGAYICNDIRCFELARKKKGLERSFKQAISQEVYDELQKAIGAGTSGGSGES